MNQSSDRVKCPHCNADNFATSGVCWQCGKPLQAQSNQTPAGNQGPIQPEPGSAYPPASPSSDTRIYIILGFIFAGLALLVCPPGFGIAAIVMGVIAKSKGDNMGVWVIVAGVACLVIGATIGAVLFLKAMQQAKQNMPTVPTGPSRYVK